jgi:taurine dioxygenase
MTTLHSSPLPDAPFGVQVELDLSRELSDDVEQELRVLLATNDILVVPGGMTADEQMRLCSVFGRVLPQGPRVIVNERPALPLPEVMYLSNMRPEDALGNDELAYHYEFAYLSTPSTGLSLYAEDVGDGQSGTRFVSGRLAYQQLPEELKERLERLQGLFVAQYDAGIRKSLGRHRDRVVDPRYPRAVHPIVVPHPVTGEKVLYVTNAQVDRILGLPDDESEKLLDTLFGYLYDPANIYEYRYRPGDCLVWDNLTAQHGRPPAESTIPRTLRRVVFGEKAPWEEWPYVSPSEPGVPRT